VLKPKRHVAGAVVGRRYAPRVQLDSAVIVVAGLIALLLWFGSWLGLFLFGGRAV
jgi:hypothetical protein